MPPLALLGSHNQRWVLVSLVFNAEVHHAVVNLPLLLPFTVLPWCVEQQVPV